MVILMQIVIGAKQKHLMQMTFVRWEKGERTEGSIYYISRCGCRIRVSRMAFQSLVDSIVFGVVLVQLRKEREMSRLDFCKYELVDDCYDWKNDNCDECNIFKAYCEGARRAKNLIVRCKDCTHYDGWCDVHFQPRLETDFCNYGEMKGGAK